MSKTWEKSLATILVPDNDLYGDNLEFFKRELNLSMKKEESTSYRPLPPRSLIYCHDIEHWSKRLSNSKPGSISVIFSANEYYNVEKWRKIEDFSSIKMAFCEYLPMSVSPFPIALMAKMIGEDKKAIFHRAFLSSLLKANDTARNLRKFRMKKPLFPMPLGYTNRLVSELKTLGLIKEDNSSILDSNLGSNWEKKNRVSFFGQKGSWYRRRMVEHLENIAQAQIVRYGSFGGFDNLTTSTEYAESILESDFVICPPGNMSSQTFRYYEIIALGALPIISEISIQDWTVHNYWPKELSWQKFDYVEIWRNLDELNCEDARNLNRKMRQHILKPLREIRNILTEFSIS